MTLLTINSDRAMALIAIAIFCVILVSIQIVILIRQNATKDKPRTLSRNQAGDLFVVLDLDLENEKILLQHGIGSIESFFLPRYWYRSEHIPAAFLVKEKGFKLLYSDTMEFQEVFNRMLNDLGGTITVEKGKPVKSI